MFIKRCYSLWIVSAAFIIFLAGCASEPPVHLMGAYRFPDGRLISIRASTEETLRYREYLTSASSRLHPAGALRYVSGPGFMAKEPVELTVEFHLGGDGVAAGLTWSRKGEQPVELERVSREEMVTFRNGDVKLSGRIDLPPGPGLHPAVVFAHGSGKDPAVESLPFGDFFAANGIAALTFDKRGTGDSGGEYTMDFHVLAGDVAAAAEFLASRPDIDGNRIGISGYSQGGWVGPLAASMTPAAKWVIVNYGMIESPAYEARMETLNLLRDRGVGGEDLAKADELTIAAIELVAQAFRGGWEEFNAAREKYRGEPWMKQLEGSPVGELLKYPRWLVRIIGPSQLPPGLEWNYDSAALLDTLQIPMVWILGGKDREAPNLRTIETLERMIADGRPYELILFPEAEHGMIEYSEGEDGGMIPVGYSKGYFATQVLCARRFSGLGGGDSVATDLP